MLAEAQLSAPFWLWEAPQGPLGLYPLLPPVALTLLTKPCVMPSCCPQVGAATATGVALLKAPDAFREHPWDLFFFFFLPIFFHP